MTVEHVTVNPNDLSGLVVLGCNFWGEDDDLTVDFPEGTVQQDENTFILPGGSAVMLVEPRELTLAWRTR